MSSLGLEAIRNDLVDVALKCGSIITSADPSHSAVLVKKSSADLVTETDKAVEKVVFTILKSKYPTFRFIGEETWKQDDHLTDDPTFIVDPIDGTSNFIHGFPAVCISLALVNERKPTVGVVYNPFQQDLWTATKDGGAYYQRGIDGDRRKLPLGPNPPPLSFRDANIGIEWGSDRDGPNFDLNLKVFTILATKECAGGRMVNSLRCTGSAAITICRVAAGQQDMFWECGCWIWDVAAAWCVLNEAGGIIVDGHPGNWEPAMDGRRYLAVRYASSGQKEIIEGFWDIIGKDRSTYGA